MVRLLSSCFPFPIQVLVWRAPFPSSPKSRADSRETIRSIINDRLVFKQMQWMSTQHLLSCLDNFFSERISHQKYLRTAEAGLANHPEYLRPQENPYSPLTRGNYKEASSHAMDHQGDGELRGSELLHDDPRRQADLLRQRCKWGDVEELKRLLAENPTSIVLNAADEDGWTALHISAANGNEEIVKALLQKEELDTQGVTRQPAQVTADVLAEQWHHPAIAHSQYHTCPNIPQSLSFRMFQNSSLENP